MTRKRVSQEDAECKEGTGLATNGLAAHIRMAAKYGPDDADTALVLTVANEIGENGLDPLDAWRKVLAEKYPEIYSSHDSGPIPLEINLEARSA